MYQKLKLKVDRRESKVASIISKYADVEVTTLPLGDIASENCIIERKDFQDFVNSMIDGRLFSQLTRMFRSDKPNFLFVHGAWEIKRDVNWKQIAGAVASTLVRYGCPVLFFISDNKSTQWKYFDTAMYIAAKVCEKVEQGKFLKPRLAYKYKRRVAPLKVEKVRKLFSIPTIVAARLLKRFGSIKGICNASFEELYSVSGIGDVRAREILKSVN